jgi:hypothetical protein
MTASISQADHKVRPLWLWRRWKRAAGPLAGWHIPAAPFTALQMFGAPQLPLRQRQNPADLDRMGRAVAERLGATDQAEAVRAGEAAFVLDLPGALCAGIGYHLQEWDIAPVLLFGGLYRPGSLLEGGASLPALKKYGRQLRPWQAADGLAFLLERERTGPQDLDDLGLWRTFDNRYHVGEHLFPSLETLKEGGLSAFIDLRFEEAELPEDINEFYQSAAQSGFDIYQATLPAEWLLEGQDEAL